MCYLISALLYTISNSYRWPDPPLDDVHYEHNVVNEQSILESFAALQMDALCDPMAADSLFDVSENQQLQSQPSAQAVGSV